MMMILQVCLVATLLAKTAYASYGYGNSVDGGGGGGSFGGSLSGGLAGFAGIAHLNGRRGGGGGGRLGSLPVQRNRRVEFVPIALPVPQPIVPAQLQVDSQQNPISLVYRSHSVPINILQKHIPSRPTFKQSKSLDEPTRHVHTIHKPVIQEVREIITPYRRVIQTIQPVMETIDVLVHKATPGGGGGSAGSGSDLGGGSGSGSDDSWSSSSYSSRAGGGDGGRVVFGPSTGVAAGAYAGLAATSGAY